MRALLLVLVGVVLGAGLAALVVALLVAPEWVALLALVVFAVALLARPGPGAPRWMLRGWYWPD